MSKKIIMKKLGISFLTWRRWLQKGYARYGITLKQYSLLGTLSRKEYLHPSDIAEQLFCDRPTATVILTNMEKSGWLIRERDPDNGKRQRIYITDAGRQKKEEIASDPEKPENAFDPEACFTEEEREIFIRLLDKLEKHLSHLPEPSGK